jgi:SAM-dependent methyltransferase
MSDTLETEARRAPPVDRSLPPENLSGHTKKLRFLLEQLERHMARVGRPVTLLDFGCGNGSAVSRFLMLEGVRYYGVDFHEPSLSYARLHFGGPRATFVDRVPEDVIFDALVYSDVLEHLDDPLDTIRGHAAMLAEDGILIGCAPNGYGPFENEKRLDRWLKLGAVLDLPGRIRRNLIRHPSPGPAGEAVPYNSESGHVQFFTRRALRALLARAGFELGEFRNGAFVGAPLSERYLLRGARIARWNARAADWLPYWAVSTWLFSAKRVKASGGESAQST